MTSAHAHIQTRLKALNNTMQTLTKNLFKKLREDETNPWHDVISYWSAQHYYPNPKFKFPLTSPLEWARKPLQRPKYTNEYIPP